MPILWRYFLSSWWKIFLLSVFSFIAFLLTLRFDEIAHFAASGASISLIALFTLYQIPYILPIVLPISSLLASAILMQRFSSSQELTAFRASGFSIKALLTPILFSAALISLINFYIASEIATASHSNTNKLKAQLKSVNPFILLQHKKFLKNRGIIFHSLGNQQYGESAENVILVTKGYKNENLLFVAKDLKRNDNAFEGHNITLISTLKDENEEKFFIENMKESHTPLHHFSDLIRESVWSVRVDYLPLQALIQEARDSWTKWKEAQITHQPSQKIRESRHTFYQTISEGVRRLSLMGAVFSFTLMGCSFGINIARQKKPSGLIAIVVLATFYLICFFAAQGFNSYFYTSIVLYTFPLTIMLWLSLHKIRKINRGFS